MVCRMCCTLTTRGNSAPALARGCQQYWIKPQCRSKRTPQYGGHIERLIGRTIAEVHYQRARKGEWRPCRKVAFKPMWLPTNTDRQLRRLVFSQRVVEFQGVAVLALGLLLSFFDQFAVHQRDMSNRAVKTQAVNVRGDPHEFTKSGRFSGI